MEKRNLVIRVVHRGRQVPLTPPPGQEVPVTPVGFPSSATRFKNKLATVNTSASCGEPSCKLSNTTGPDTENETLCFGPETWATHRRRLKFLENVALGRMTKCEGMRTVRYLDKKVREKRKTFVWAGVHLSLIFIEPKLTLWAPVALIAAKKACQREIRSCLLLSWHVFLFPRRYVPPAPTISFLVLKSIRLKWTFFPIFWPMWLRVLQHSHFVTIATVAFSSSFSFLQWVL